MTSGALRAGAQPDRHISIHGHVRDYKSLKSRLAGSGLGRMIPAPPSGGILS